MPGYVIHLAVGKVYMQNNQISNIREFERGIIAPDLTNDKTQTHYGPNSSNPNLDKYLQIHTQINEFEEGYFLHLFTDYLFYNKFLEKCSSDIYNDYDILNKAIIEKYGIKVPKEVQNVVKYKTGRLKILDEKKLYKFIEDTGRINIREIINKKKKYK